MRILAVSDIHNNVACVRKLLAQESNSYDVIVFPGDIGTYRAAEIFDMLKTFECPIVLIHGNWDRAEDVILWKADASRSPSRRKGRQARVHGVFVHGPAPEGMP